MITKTFFLLTILSGSVLVSCNKTAPAGFWKSYENNLLVKNMSDQGPYGGHRAIYWKSSKANTFTSIDVLKFAGKNGWTLVDSSEFSSSQTNKWIYNNKAIFPLTSTGFSDRQLNDAHLTDFPRWFGGQVSVYKFKTGWVAIEPGVDNYMKENGFVVINNSRSEMAVYHLWGE